MDILYSSPAALTGDQSRDIQSLYAWAFRLGQELRVAETAIQTRTNREIARAMEETGFSKESAAEAAGALRSLIINTAEIIRTEADQLETRLGKRINAVSSQFGSLDEWYDNKITASAEGILQQFNYSQVIEALNEEMAGFQKYQTTTQGFIKSGFIDRKVDGTPIIGIAIGNTLNSTTVTYGGKEYEQLDEQINCAFYTADRVSFYVNGNMVAYFSNQALHCGSLELEGSVTMAGKWHLETNGHLTLTWIGGE